MARARRIAIITFVASASVVATFGAAIPQAASAVGHPSPLTHAASAHPAHTAVVGRTSNFVVYNDTSNRVVYLGNPAGKAAPQALARNATATAVSGDLVEYTAGGKRLWRKVGTSSHGSVPSSWNFLAPDGGMRVRHSGAKLVLDYLHLDGTTQSYPLPSTLPSANTHYSVVASTDGVAVAASAPSTRPKVAYSTLAGPAAFVLLKTDGIGTGTMRCVSLSVEAVGCLSGHSAIRLGTNGTDLPQVSTLSAQPLDVAVTDGYTTWVTPRTTGSHSCPCNMASLDTTGTAVSIVAGLTSGAVASGRGRFFYSSGTAASQAGVYVDLFAGAGDDLVAPAARRPLMASGPALAPGRAVWADDSRSSGALWAARVRPNSTRGAARQQAGQVVLSPVAVSGQRIVYSSARHSLHVMYRGTDRAVGRGRLVSLSGSLLLFRSLGAHPHLMLVDLVHGTTVDETRTQGAQSASLWGQYLSFLRANGSVWRVGVAGTRAHRPVRLARATAASRASGQIYSYGNWVAWTVQRPDGPAVSAWRNAAGHAAAHRLDASDTLVGASYGGPIVARSHAGGTLADFALLSWGSGALRATLPGRGAVPSVDRSTVGWLRNGVPTVADIGVPVHAEARSLGNPAVTTRVESGSAWRLDLPTSAPLTSCTVVLRHASQHWTVPCAAAQLAEGDVFVHWRSGSAPSGRYTWVLHARGKYGRLLRANGAAGVTAGHFTVS